MFETLYDYYLEQKEKPTYAAFKTTQQMLDYAKLRQQVFRKLMLPSAYFEGKKILEIGPDTGENSVVFAHWGSKLTLVEPNVTSHEYIHRYFNHFGLSTSLKEIHGESLEAFNAIEKFDMIDAEGFIYTIQPHSVWLKKASTLLKPGGLFVISCMELYGSFMELITKMIFYQTIYATGAKNEIGVAKKLFEPKWNSIPHTRKFESWFMDVIKNPFVRKKYFIDPACLLKEARKWDFFLYSSHPNYRNVLEMEWIKNPLDKDKELHEMIRFVEMSRLSHFFCLNCFSTTTMDPLLNEALLKLVSISDELIDLINHDLCDVALDTSSIIRKFLNDKLEENKNFKMAIELLDMVEEIFKLIRESNISSLIDFCRCDERFIKMWGMPNHHLVFQYQ